MKAVINILKSWSLRNIIMIMIIVATVFLPEIWYYRVVTGAEIKCRNFCCIMFIKAIGVVIKHDGIKEDRILHSRTCELLENTDPHEYLFCDDIELAFGKGFVICESCNLMIADNDPCTARCCKYYGWIIEPITGIMHRKDCHFLSIVKARFYQDLAFVCSSHNTEEELIDKALVERKANYRVCNSCFRDIIPKRYKLQPGLLRYYEGGEVEYSLETVGVCLITIYR